MEFDQILIVGYRKTSDYYLFLKNVVFTCVMGFLSYLMYLKICNWDIFLLRSYNKLLRFCKFRCIFVSLLVVLKTEIIQLNTNVSYFLFVKIWTTAILKIFWHNCWMKNTQQVQKLKIRNYNPSVEATASSMINEASKLFWHEHHFDMCNLMSRLFAIFEEI